MKSSGRSLSLTSYDDLFSTDESRADIDREKVMEIPLSELFPFKDHPFRVKDDDKMQETAESIKEYGVLVPALARPREDGGYELIAGHRRKRGCELAGLDTMPVIVRDMDDDAAVIVMVDSNIQRESLLPSERAFAYKMKLDAIKHQGTRADLTSTQVAQKLSVEKVGADAGISKVEDRAEEDEVVAADEGEPIGPVPLHEREVKHIDHLSLEHRGVPFAPRHELRYAIGGTLREDGSIEHAVDDITQRTGYDEGHTHEISLGKPLATYLAHIIDEEADGHDTEEREEQFPKDLHTECHTRVFGEVDVEPVGDVDALIEAHA